MRPGAAGSGCALDERKGQAVNTNVECGASRSSVWRSKPGAPGLAAAAAAALVVVALGTSASEAAAGQGEVPCAGPLSHGQVVRLLGEDVSE